MATNECYNFSDLEELKTLFDGEVNHSMSSIAREAEKA